MIIVFEFQRWVDGMDNPPKWLKFAPKIALAVSIGKMDDIYKTIAYRLNDKGKKLKEHIPVSWMVKQEVKIRDVDVYPTSFLNQRQQDLNYFLNLHNF